MAKAYAVHASNTASFARLLDGVEVRMDLGIGVHDLGRFGDRKWWLRRASCEM